MARGPRYRHDARKYIVTALDMMLENLNAKLKVTDEVTGELDTIEYVRKLDEDLEVESTEEDREKFLNENRDASTAQIGHIQRRIEDVKQLKAAFASNEAPPKDVIEKTYRALKDSIVFEAMCFHGLLLNPDKSTWSGERLAEHEKERKSIFLYCQALTIGFGIWPKMRWHLFPFDDL